MGSFSLWTKEYKCLSFLGFHEEPQGASPGPDVPSLELQALNRAAGPKCLGCFLRLWALGRMRRAWVIPSSQEWLPCSPHCALQMVTSGNAWKEKFKHCQWNVCLSLKISTVSGAGTCSPICEAGLQTTPLGGLNPPPDSSPLSSLQERSGQRMSAVVTVSDCRGAAVSQV